MVKFSKFTKKKYIYIYERFEEFLQANLEINFVSHRIFKHAWLGIYIYIYIKSNKFKYW